MSELHRHLLRRIGFAVIGDQTLLATRVFYSLFDAIITPPLWGKLRDAFERSTVRFRVYPARRFPAVLLPCFS